LISTEAQLLTFLESAPITDSLFRPKGEVVPIENEILAAAWARKSGSALRYIGFGRPKIQAFQSLRLAKFAVSDLAQAFGTGKNPMRH
jgi:hypothetical protein